MSPSLAPQANASALFGASFAIRTMINMIERALRALGRLAPGIHAFKTEAEARAYLEQERQRLGKSR